MASTPNSPVTSLRGGVLVGGASRRMGTAKQLLVHHGMALAERAVAALAPHCEEVLLLGDGHVPAALDHLSRLSDAALPIPGHSPSSRKKTPDGPLAGMLAALRQQPASAWIFAACDLARIRDEAVEWLVSERRPGRAVVLVRPHPNEPVQPLFSLYEPRALALLEGLADRGERAPRAIEGLPGVETVSPPLRLADCWRGVNTPEELEALEAE